VSATDPDTDEIDAARGQNSAVTTWSEIDESLLRWFLGREDDPEWMGHLQLTIRPQPETLPQFGGPDNAQVDLHSSAYTTTD
jgi:hypothetical protein